MKFKGTIIITDPCYIDTEDNKLWDGKVVDILSKKFLDLLNFKGPVLKLHKANKNKKK